MTAPAHLSYSSYSTLLECGEKYRLTRIDRVPESPAWYNIGGSAVHAATEWFDLGLDIDAQGLFDQAFAQELTDVEDTADIRAGGRATKEWPGGEDHAWWQFHGPQFVQAWIDWRTANPNLSILQIEGRPAIEVDVVAIINDVPLKGFIDRVMVDTETGELLIVDLKTGRMTPHSPLQLGFYRLALSRTVGLTADHGAYWMARKGALSSIEHLWYPDSLLESWLTQARRLIDTGIFLPHVGMLCGSCSVRTFCSAHNLTTNSDTTE